MPHLAKKQGLCLQWVPELSQELMATEFANDFFNTRFINDQLEIVKCFGRHVAVVSDLIVLI